MPPRKKLDETDLNILAELYENSRITNKELSAKTKIAPSTCLERVKKLQSLGVIKAFSLDIDYAAIGGNIEAMISVKLGKHSSEVIKNFSKDLVEHPEVLRVFYMSGNYDFLLHITITDTLQLRNFILRAVTSRSEVTHIETTLIFEQLSSNILPLRAN